MNYCNDDANNDDNDTLMMMMMEDVMENVMEEAAFNEEEKEDCCCCSAVQLEQLPLDTSCLVLSFVEFADLQRLGVCSRRLYATVSKTSHLFMNEACEQSPNGATRPRTTETHSYIHSRRQQQREGDLQSFGNKAVRLNERSLQNLLDRFTNLKELHLSGLAPVGDKLLQLLNQAPAASTLESLTLHGATLTYWCPDVLDLPQLQRLCISGGSTGGSIRASLALLLGKMTSLESLSICQCSTLRDDQLRALLKPMSDSLKELNIHQCLRIRRPRIEVCGLERLSLMGCFALSELPNVFAPTLRELNLSFCFRLSTQSIQETIDRLPCLETLTLVKCPLLESLHVQYRPRLRLLNVNYCNALATLQVTQCPALSVLENNGCVLLKTVVLQDVSSLEYLNLSCLPIRRLVVVAPFLVHLELENCRHLDDCLVRSPRLQRVNVRGSRTVALRFCKEIRSVLLQNYWMLRTPMDL